MDSAHYLTLLLVSQPHAPLPLTAMHEPLRQRIAVQYHLKVSARRTRRLLPPQLKAAGIAAAV